MTHFERAIARACSLAFVESASQVGFTFSFSISWSDRQLHEAIVDQQCTEPSRQGQVDCGGRVYGGVMSALSQLLSGLKTLIAAAFCAVSSPRFFS